MFKRKNNKKGIVAMAGAMAIMGGMLAQATPAYAAAPGDGTTPVIYDNRQVLPDGNGEYGMIIPTAIAFTDDSTKANADVEITGINGYELKDWSELSVKASVKSQNSYSLILDGGSESAKYQLAYGSDLFDHEDGSVVSPITQKLGIGGTGNEVKAAGTATLTDKSGATKKGKYKDTLTYSFEELRNTKR